MKKSSLFVRLACGLAAAVLFASCYSTPSRDRGSLSDAMDAARDDSEDRSVPDKPRYSRDDPYDNPYDDPWNRPIIPVFPVRPARDAGPEEAQSDAVAVSVDLILGLRYGISPYVLSNDADRLDDFAFLVGFSGESKELFATLSAKVIEPAAGSRLSLAIDGYPLMLSAGGEFRYLPFQGRTLLSPWIGFGAEVFIMGWEFKNPLQAGSDTITTDALGGINLYPSLGLYLVRNEHVSVSVFALPAASLFREMTAEGFDNDFFSPMLSCQAGVEVLFR
ncbi:MAG: hypothetical protein EWM51_05815 [Treponema sp.]|nr:MAG: hypothetical protein EWM51_05815 [Treponema sp.]